MIIGLLTKAGSAKEVNEEAEIEEQIKLAYIEWQTAKLTGTTENANDFIKNRLDKIYANIEEVIVDNKKIAVIINENGQEYSYKYDINLGTINKSYKDYVGYYADIEADGIVDGVIFADLLVGNTKGTQWVNTNSAYTIPTINIENLKEYYVSKENYEGSFGTKNVISPKMNSKGECRFYIMSLSNFSKDSNYRFYWYSSATNMENITLLDFGKGRENTDAIIDKWTEEKYGEQDIQDIWGNISTQVSKGWFVPSRGEWAAFANELEITIDNYNSKYGLEFGYWSSSQHGGNFAWRSTFYMNDINTYHLYGSHFVRLATTF